MTSYEQHTRIEIMTNLNKCKVKMSLIAVLRCAMVSYGNNVFTAVLHVHT